MKCKDCYAKNGEEICLIGEKSRMLVCGHHGCDLQMRVVERRMGITKPITNADRIRAMTDEELAKHLYWWDNVPLHASSERWLEWLRQEVEDD